MTDDVLSDGAAAYTPGVSRHTGAGTTFEGGDYIGTNRVETNSSQSVTGTRTYDAFGNLESTTGSPVGPFGFNGQNGYQGDPDSGLQLLGHRYYDPTTGRFLTRDPAGDGRNWYAYCDNNPVIEIDCSGLTGFIDFRIHDLPYDQTNPPPDKPRWKFNESEMSTGSASGTVSVSTGGDTVTGGGSGGFGKKPKFSFKNSLDITRGWKWDLLFAPTLDGSGIGIGYSHGGNKFDYERLVNGSSSLSFSYGPWGVSGTFGPGFPTTLQITNGPGSGIYYGVGGGPHQFFVMIGSRN